MKLLKNIAKSLSVIRKSNNWPEAPSIQSWVSGDDLDEAQGAIRFTSPYSQSAWIYVAVSVLAENLAQVPFRISRGRARGEHLVESGPVIDLFDHPHPAMTRALFWQTLVSWEALRGEFFIVALDADDQPVSVGNKGARSRIARMIPLNPECFNHIVDGYELMGWRYTGLERMSPLPEQVLLPEEVIHSRNFNPYLFWRGLSPLSVALLPAMSDYTAEQFMKGLMSNNADAGLIVTTREILTKEQRQQMLAALNERKRRAGTADKPLFLWGDGLSIQKPVISSADLEFLENRKLNRQEIGAIFKVPESMMGFAAQKSALSAGTAIEQDRLTFIENTIGSLCKRLEAALEPIVRSFGGDLYGWFDLESLPVLQQARRDRMLTAEKAFAMGVPFNEINEVYDLGFRALPWGDRGFLPHTMAEVGTLPAQAERLTIPPEQKSAEVAIERMLGRIAEYEAGSEPGGEDSDALKSPPGMAALPGVASALISSSIRSKAGKLRKFFFEQRGRVLERLDEFCKSKAPSAQTPPLDLKSLFPREEEDELLFVRMKPLLIADLRAGYAESRGTHAPSETELPTSEIEFYVASRRAILARANQSTEAAVLQAVREGLAGGSDFSGLAERLKQVLQAASDAAESMAREETVCAIERGRTEALRSNLHGENRSSATKVTNW